MDVLRILLVDDEYLPIDAVHRALAAEAKKRKIEAEFVLTSNPEEALAKANEASLQGNPFDAVVTDYNMGRESGMQLAEALRALHVYKHTPIILNTARPEGYIEDNHPGKLQQLNVKYNDKLEFSAKQILDSIINSVRSLGAGATR